MGSPIHDLFDPPDDAGAARDIHWLLLHRLAPGKVADPKSGNQVPASIWLRHPKKFQAAELPDVETVAARFGGGHYRVKALSEEGAKISAWSDFVIPGAPLPFSGEEQSAPPPPTVQAYRPPPPPQQEPTPAWLTAAITVAVPLLVKYFEAQSANAALAQQQQQQLLLALLSQARGAAQDVEKVAGAQNAVFEKGLEMGLGLAKAATEHMGAGAAGDSEMMSQAMGALFEMIKAKKSQPQAPQPQKEPNAPTA